MLNRLVALVCATLLLTACNPAEKLRDPAAQTLVERTVERLQQRDPTVAESFTPEIRPDLTQPSIDQFAQELPAGAPSARKAISTNVTSTGYGTSITTVDEYMWGDRPVVVQARVVRSGSGPWQISDLRVQPATAEQIAAQRFFAPGKPAKQYLFLLAVLLSPLLMIAALVKVIRTKGLKRKWLWGFVAFLGLLQFQMNWTTGAIAWGLAVQLIGAGVMKAGVSIAPWLLSVTIPVGALLILTGVIANPGRPRAKKMPTPGPAAAD